MPSSPDEPGRVPEPGSPEEALRRLEQRLDQASEAAERLMAQAGAAAAARVAAGAGESAAGTGESAAGGNPGGAPGQSAAGGNPGGAPGQSGPGAGDPATPPPAGWQTTDDGTRGSTSELDPLVALVQAVRDLIPPDLQQRLIAAFREVLLALRALIDWYLDRLDRRREQGVEVQDIPIL
ncbi:MAG TPA: hypothetical protein VG057_08765 [Solirubrobacteraceae bacterium]|nr:hypothetical protein [Solirubrobacteraceae bacterium]